MSDDYFFQELMNDVSQDYDNVHYGRTKKSSKSLSLGVAFGDKDSAEKFIFLGSTNGLVLAAAVIVGAIMAEELEGSSVTLEQRFKEFFLWFSIIAIPGLTLSNVVLGSSERFQSRQLGIAQASVAILFAIYYYRQQSPDDYIEKDEYVNLLITACIWTMINSIAIGNPMVKMSGNDKSFIKLKNWFQLASVPSHLASIAILITGPYGTLA